MAGAPHTVFFKVVLPLILPGVISGALFAFVTSFDEVIVILFIGGPEQRTLPRQMFSGIREQISPTITAAASVLIVFSTIMLVTVELLRRRGERLRGIKSLGAALEVHGKRRCRFSQAGGLCVSLHEICGTGKIVSGKRLADLV